MRRGAFISLGHPTFAGWDSGRECCRWEGTTVLHRWPTAGAAVPKRSTAHTSGGHVAHTLCKQKKLNLCLANEFRWRASKLPRKWSHQAGGCRGAVGGPARAGRGLCHAVPRDPRLSRLLAGHPLHRGRGRRKESRALICSICSGAANWIVGAQGKVLDRVLGTWSLLFPWTELLQHCCPAPLHKPFPRAALPRAWIPSTAAQHFCPKPSPRLPCLGHGCPAPPYWRGETKYWRNNPRSSHSQK